MVLSDWYAGRELFLTGATSDVGRALLEKILRSFPTVTVYALIRSRNGYSKDDRLRNILQSPRFERLRQECPTAITRVKAIEGNLVYENLGLRGEDRSSLSKVSIAFHAGGPHEAVFEFYQELPRLEVAVSVSNVFKGRHHVNESLANENVPNFPIALVRVPCVGPAYREPMPGFVDTFKGATALMIGAGFASGNSELQAQVIPIDLLVNTLLSCAWERDTLKDVQGAVVYNAASLDCTWGDLIKKGRRANRKFAYPTFGIRGMTSIQPLHWILVLLLEWLPSLLCDTIFALCSGKQRFIKEYMRVREALGPLESVTQKSWTIERKRVYALMKKLSIEDAEAFPLTAEIDLESYILCAAAATRKHCVDEAQVNIVKALRIMFYLLIIGGLFSTYFLAAQYTTVKQRVES